MSSRAVGTLSSSSLCQAYPLRIGLELAQNLARVSVVRSCGSSSPRRLGRGEGSMPALWRIVQ